LSTVTVSWAPRVAEALVPDTGRIVACRVDAGGLWHCECRPNRPLYRPHADECCPHLYALGSTPITKKEN